MTLLKPTATMLFLYLLSQTSLNTMTGKVVAVNSGDTITLDVSGENFQIRLADIDCPDVKQPFYSQAKKFTERRVLGKKVRVNYEVMDQLRRVIGEAILPDGSSLNLELMKAGWAWHYNVRFPPKEIFSRLEYDAWSHKLGLWIDPGPVPPWEFRRDALLADKEPPSGPSEVDYEQVLGYGLVGDKRAKTYFWPQCKGYHLLDPKDRAIFSNRLEAQAAGFNKAKGCD